MKLDRPVTRPDRSDAPRIALGNGPASAAPPYVLYTTMATWCPACKRNIPQGHQVRARFSKDELTFVGVPIDAEDTNEKLREYLEEYDPAYDLLFDLPDTDVAQVQSLVLHEFESEVLPASILTDREGRVVRLIAGVPTISELRRLMTGAPAER